MKIYLAALEMSEAYAPIKEGLIENGFFSFYYMRNKKEPPLTLEVAKGCGLKNIIIDSGAHSFFVQSDEIKAATNVKAKSKVKETPDEYFQKYLDWIQLNWVYFDYFVELDIGEIVGQEKVIQWRNQLRERGFYKKCLPVFHPAVMTWDDYMEMLITCESGYVGIEGIRSPSFVIPYRKYIKEAYQLGIKIHGFAMTKRDSLEEFPFYSVDSNSWKSGIMYGAGLKVTDNGIETVRYRNKNDFGRTAGKIDVDVVFGEDKAASSAMILSETSKAYAQMQKHYTELWTQRNIIWK
jgi:hypothetical protein